MTKISTFTVKGKGILRCLQTNIGISKSRKLANDKKIKPKTYVGIWDTGATNTAVTPRVARELELFPISKTKTNTANGIKECNVYLVDLLLPNNVLVTDVMVTEANLGEGADVLIGMDIITKGDFCISNYQGKTTMSFRMPSMGTTDYVRLYSTLGTVTRKGEKVGRNEPCPCGSGRKHKNCCGNR